MVVAACIMIWCLRPGKPLPVAPEFDLAEFEKAEVNGLHENVRIDFTTGDSERWHRTFLDDDLAKLEAAGMITIYSVEEKR